jgi:hypothetical protein
MRLDAETGHNATKAGRRRSKFGVTATFVDSSVSPAITYTASAYVVLDQTELGSVKDINMRNAALSALENALLASRAANSDNVPTQTVIDWLNGEP